MDGTSISNPNLIEDDDPFNILAYFSSLQNQDQNFPFTNDNFAHELQLQETLLSSISPPSSSPPSSSMILCEICMDTKPNSQMFRNTDICTHLYCLDCIRGHVAAKIKENITKVKCPHPQCVGQIGPEACRWIVPKEVIERWEDSLCESSILASEKVMYCPFKDCSAMLVDDGGETVTSSVCPNCNRLFCASCKVGWHAGLDCSEFRSRKSGGTDREDKMLVDLANGKKWKRCPKCKFFVEKVSGCLQIICRLDSFYFNHFSFFVGSFLWKRYWVVCKLFAGWWGWEWRAQLARDFRYEAGGLATGWRSNFLCNFPILMKPRCIPMCGFHFCYNRGKKFSTSHYHCSVKT
ncbi:hypothetical protein OSB04_028627 [Centaurea solstitialis]|uniref:RBR-type E3 ubiquitin transferase n=1 Tax=Centaurea solstitialis TaxID=347529 RepID=A0AA38WBD2_9ASTR|nr:hypothetical protein OSB04_028627 [Centaurea solstitialis]